MRDETLRQTLEAAIANVVPSALAAVLQAKAANRFEHPTSKRAFAEIESVPRAFIKQPE
jgi:hypothetical protein